MLVAPSATASWVSATFTSIRLCDEGKLPQTLVISTPSTSSELRTRFTKTGNTHTAATWGRSGCVESILLTFSTMARMLSSVSVV